MEADSRNSQFEMPPTGNIWAIIIVSNIHIGIVITEPRSAVLTWRQINSLSSFVSDISWAFAMLLTTPLVVTVGLSLSIPVSLIGEMIQYGRYSSFVYWLGAAVVFISFVFVNNESREESEEFKESTESERTAPV